MQSLTLSQKKNLKTLLLKWSETVLIKRNRKGFVFRYFFKENNQTRSFKYNQTAYLCSKKVYS